MMRVNSDDIEFSNDYRYLWHGMPFSGVAFELSDGGRLLSEMEFREGIQHGTTREFFESGGTKREAEYEYNTLHGFVREFDEGGRLVSEDEYEKGICVRRKSLDSSGSLVTTYVLDESSPQSDLLDLLRRSKFVNGRETGT